MANHYLNTPPAYWSAPHVLGSSGPSASLLAACCLRKWPPRGRRKGQTESLEGSPSLNEVHKKHYIEINIYLRSMMIVIMFCFITLMIESVLTTSSLMTHLKNNIIGTSESVCPIFQCWCFISNIYICISITPLIAQTQSSAIRKNVNEYSN